MLDKTGLEDLSVQLLGALVRVGLISSRKSKIAFSQIERDGERELTEFNEYFSSLYP